MKSTLYFALFSASQILGAPLSANILDRMKPRLFRYKLMNFLINKNTFFEKKFNKKELFKIRYFLLRFVLFDKTKDFFSYILFSPIQDFCRFYLRNLFFLK